MEKRVRCFMKYYKLYEGRSGGCDDDLPKFKAWVNKSKEFKDKVFKVYLYTWIGEVHNAEKLWNLGVRLIDRQKEIESKVKDHIEDIKTSKHRTRHGYENQIKPEVLGKAVTSLSLNFPKLCDYIQNNESTFDGVFKNQEGWLGSGLNTTLSKWDFIENLNHVGIFKGKPERLYVCKRQKTNGMRQGFELIMGQDVGRFTDKLSEVKEYKFLNECKKHISEGVKINLFQLESALCEFQKLVGPKRYKEGIKEISHLKINEDELMAICKEWSKVKNE